MTLAIDGNENVETGLTFELFLALCNLLTGQKETAIRPCLYKKNTEKGFLIG